MKYDHENCRIGIGTDDGVNGVSHTNIDWPTDLFLAMLSILACKPLYMCFCWKENPANQGLL